MSEAELHVIKARLRGGILNKVRRGEYRCPLPTGFIYDEVGDVVLDPDAQIREMIAHFFETFARAGSATQTIKAFAREGLLFPSRLRNGKQVVFQPLTASTAMRTLHNPRYAGVYAYGQRLYRRTVDGKKQLRKRDPKDWLACIQDAHPGYISWDQFQHNLKVLEDNGAGYQAVRASPPREGAALLQGRAVCGRCGSHMTARYATRRGQVDRRWRRHGRGSRRRASACNATGGPGKGGSGRSGTLRRSARAFGRRRHVVARLRRSRGRRASSCRSCLARVRYELWDQADRPGTDWHHRPSAP